MKENCNSPAKAGSTLVFCVLAFVSTAWTCAAVEPAPATVPAAAPERPVRLPAFKVGGLQGGDVILITDSKTERMKAALLAQQVVARSSQFSDFCRSH